MIGTGTAGAVVTVLCLQLFTCYDRAYSLKLVTRIQLPHLVASFWPEGGAGGVWPRVVMVGISQTPLEK